MNENTLNDIIIDYKRYEDPYKRKFVDNMFKR